jgi:histone acetyltransferase (RNA polymerase elongator complex component)
MKEFAREEHTIVIKAVNLIRFGLIPEQTLPKPLSASNLASLLTRKVMKMTRSKEKIRFRSLTTTVV